MKRKSGSGTGGIVYSTHHGSMCPKCRRPVASCDCQEARAVAADGVVRVGRETHGRRGGGKGVTVVTGVPLNAEELGKLAGELKRKCGAGGTVKDGVIEIQGDQRDMLVVELEKRGYRVRRS